MDKLDSLKPKVRQLAKKLVAECRRQIGYEIVITSTLRSFDEQDALYAQGRTTSGPIVTNARGGYSFHNFGVAFDICPLVDGKLSWDDEEIFKKIGEIGRCLGLEWGGDWASFRDLPHFQYLAGYSLEDFRNDQVDWKKFKSKSRTKSQPKKT